MQIWGKNHWDAVFENVLDARRIAGAGEMRKKFANRPPDNLLAPDFRPIFEAIVPKHDDKILPQHKAPYRHVIEQSELFRRSFARHHDIQK